MTRRGLAVPAVLVALMAGATGCGGDDSADPPDATSTASAASAPALQNATPALGDLDVASCPSGGEGRQKADGTLVNHGRHAADFVVTVRWLGDDGGIVGSASTVVEDVASKQTGQWQVATTLDHAAASCTTQASRGRLP